MSSQKVFSKQGLRHLTALRSQSNGPSQPLYLNPHKWKGLPADRVFELHEMRRAAMGEKYAPNDDERKAVLATYAELKATSPALSYSYEMDNFKERVMNNTPVALRGLPKKYANVPVLDKGETPHEKRKIEQIHRISAYEMPLLAKYRQPYKPSSQETPLKLTFNTDFSDEPTPLNRSVTLTVLLKNLKLDAQQAKKFQLLAGDKYQKTLKRFVLKADRYPESTQNARWLVETFNKLLAEAKDLTKNTFDEVPLNPISKNSKKQASKFPQSWNRPQDAPIQRHRIVNECVDAVKQRMDTEYLKSLSP